MTELMISGGFLVLLAIGVVVSDLILPHIKPLMRWVNKLSAEKEEWVRAIREERQGRHTDLPLSTRKAEQD